MMCLTQSTSKHMYIYIFNYICKLYMFNSDSNICKYNYIRLTYIYAHTNIYMSYKQ